LIHSPSSSLVSTIRGNLESYSSSQSKRYFHMIRNGSLKDSGIVMRIRLYSIAINITILMARRKKSLSLISLTAFQKK
jgi:hypothetical protein